MAQGIHSSLRDLDEEAALRTILDVISDRS